MVLSNVFLLIFCGIALGSTPDGPGMGETSEEKVTPWVIGVLPVVFEPESARGLDDRFRKAARDGLVKAGYLTVVDSKVASARVRFPLMDDCESGGCVSGIAGTLGADLLVRLRVEVAGNNYSFRLNAMDPKDRFSAKTEGRCDICTLSEAGRAITASALELGEQLRKERAALPLPPVEFGGECGEKKKCMEGLVCREGRCARPHEETEPVKEEPVEEITVEETEAEKAKIEPEPLIEKKDTAPERVHPWGQFAVVTGGVGVVALIVGASLLAVDGKPACSRPNGEIACSQRYSTKPAGAILLSTSILAGGASAVFGYLWRRARKKRNQKVEISVGPSQHGVSATALLKF